MSYQPIKILGPETGLVTQKEAFLLPDDGYTTLENAYLQYQRVFRKPHALLLGRLRRTLTAQDLGTTLGDPTTKDIKTLLSLEANAQIEPGSLVITVDGGTATFTDNGLGGFAVTGTGVALGSSINYTTMEAVLEFSAGPGVVSVTASFRYFPALPVMGIITREEATVNVETMLVFDTKYCYRWAVGGFIEYITGTTWSGSDANKFFGTNWWIENNRKLTWVTNFSGILGNPIRYTDGVTWTDFPDTGTGRGKVDGSDNYLWQARFLAPYRGLMIAGNTYEGQTNLASSLNYPNRLRYSQIGNPLLVDSWRDDIPGKGGYIDLPTTETLVAMAYVRDNIILFCDRSAYLLRFTGQAIAPLQIDRINSDQGMTSTFSVQQFDDECLAMGSRGLISANAVGVKEVDEKLQNFVFDNVYLDNNATNRMDSVRDYARKLVSYTYSTTTAASKWPNRRLLLNYQNAAWAIMKDSYTALGIFFNENIRTWASLSGTTWAEAKFPWRTVQNRYQTVVGGNQVGFVMRLDQTAGLRASLAITDIDGSALPMVATIPDHNLENGDVIYISGIPTGTAFASLLNGNKYGVNVVDSNNVELFAYDPDTKSFSAGVPITAGTYQGYGTADIVENFIIKSKKFNFLEQGQKIRLGYMDMLIGYQPGGAINLRVYADYANTSTVNDQGDDYFNNTIDFSEREYQPSGTTKTWHRVQIPVTANMVQTEFSLTDEQLNGQNSDTRLEIDAQILWARPAGRIGI